MGSVVDISQLPKLGKVAGVPGIALGTAVLLLGVVVAAVYLLPDGWRGPVMAIAVVGAVLLAVLAIFGWGRSTRRGAQVARAEGDNSEASNRDRTETGGSQEAIAKGANSRAFNEYG